MLALVVKGIPFEPKLLQLSQGEQRNPEYLAISPRGKVPALRDGSFALSESLAIMAYLDRKYPSPPLFGETAEETGAIWRAVFDHDNYAYPTLIGLIRPVLDNPSGEDRSAQIREAAPAVHDELGRLEAILLKEGDWLVGGRISAADLGVYPSIQLLLRVMSKPAVEPLKLGVSPLADRYPRLAAWCRRIEALPGYEKTYPPHWREG